MFKGWVLGEEDLYLTSINQYCQKLKNNPNPLEDEHIAGGDFVSYSEVEAREEISKYISRYLESLDKNSYFNVLLRKIVIPYNQRLEYDSEYSLVESLDLTTINVIDENTYRNKKADR